MHRTPGILLLAGILAAWSCGALAQLPPTCWPGGQLNAVSDCIYPDGSHSTHPAWHMSPSDEKNTKWDGVAEKWGALAVNNETGGYITSIGEPTQAQAESVALHQCGAGCEIYASYGNKCISWAEGNSKTVSGMRGFAGGLDPGPTVAEKKALENCGKVATKCQVNYTECAYRTRVLRYRVRWGAQGRMGPN